MAAVDVSAAMSQLAFAWEPAVPLECAIERVPCNSRLPSWLGAWKELRAAGWDVTVLLAPDEKTLVGLGCRLMRASRVPPATKEPA